MSLTILSAKDRWYSGNLKGIENLNFEFSLKGLDDDVWENRVVSFIELRFLEYDIRMVKDYLPKLVVEVHIIDSKIEKVSSFLVIFSIYDFSIPESIYYESIANGTISKKVMTSKIFSHEIMGKTSSNNLYRDVEKAINKEISFFIDQWYRDNPFKQF
ncbi:MAG: hypothetical protein HOK94_11230 [Candidatus Marinimicrobia bacterium]|jgi:hypothetical protein|nr:hypothetical protein [Candidatus Neomarinimicrobiota bacterium]MBT4283482.1 hypothetical protein [Candidatus Neomarinimicrobiota bacterium]MBT5363908.1 hypothetical protein [Candidatus Neomarinimicrobiota bacterium]MBT5462210.1 hypothetical protein [Candidatus Neomarinimicrobiota bacterium]